MPEEWLVLGPLDLLQDLALRLVDSKNEDSVGIGDGQKRDAIVELHLRVQIRLEPRRDRVILAFSVLRFNQLLLGRLEHEHHFGNSCEHDSSQCIHRGEHPG